jgi:hypothetical protein
MKIAAVCNCLSVLFPAAPAALMLIMTCALITVYYALGCTYPDVVTIEYSYRP